MHAKDLIAQELVERCKADFNSRFTSKELAQKLSLSVIIVMAHMSVLLKDESPENPLRQACGAKLDRCQYKPDSEYVYMFARWESGGRRVNRPGRPANSPPAAPYSVVS